MTEIKAISSNIQINKVPITPEQREQRKHQQEQVAAGVGGAAGLSTTATKVAGKKGLNSDAAASAEHSLQNFLEKVNHTSKTVTNNAEAATGLWSKFKSNVQIFTQDIIRRLESLKKMKYVRPFIESPITKKLAGFAGGALAFFVLITGVNKAVKTGAIAVDDFKQQYHEFNAAA